MSREQDAEVAEKVMGVQLEWHHEHLQALAVEHKDSNNGRGIFLRCRGCDLAGYGNSVDWSQRCPTPDCEPYTGSVVADYEVLRRVRDTWGRQQLDQFWYQLSRLWGLHYDEYAKHHDSLRTKHAARHLMYQPGDYSKAALLVLYYEAE
jgi:hypothetical protein